MSLEALAVIIGTTALAGLAAISAALETGLTSVSRAKIEALADEGSRRAVKLNAVLANRSQALAAILLFTLLTRIVGISLVGYFAFDRWGAGGFWVAMAAAVLMAYLITSLLPKLAALHRPERLPLMAASLLEFVNKTALFSWVTKLGQLNLGNGNHSNSAAIVSEEELLALAEQAEADASIETEERALIQAILRFGDVTAREVMVPRTDMVTLSRDQDIEAALEESLRSSFSRFPVVGQDADNIIGVVHTRDLMLAVRQRSAATGTAADGAATGAATGAASNPATSAAAANSSAPQTVDSVLRSVIFIPDTKPVADLLREMQEKRLHLAVLIDEFGGTAGLVTLEDLIEELVGEITDEFDVEEPLIERLSDGAFRVNGRVTQEELELVMKRQLPKGDWTTVGGLIFTHVGHLPTEGEALLIGECMFHVERIVGQRIARVKVAVP